MSSLFVVYYWLPPRLDAVELTRDQIATLGIFLLAGFEAYRIHRGWLFFGLRDYEKKWVAGYFWGALGYVTALLFFEQRFAMITILGTTLVDPVLGEVRASARKKWAPAVGCAAWCGVALVCVVAAGLTTPLLFVPLGAAIAVGAESIRTRWVDDNLLMNLIPVLCLTALAAVTGL
jgi:dolichol kinase